MTKKSTLTKSSKFVNGTWKYEMYDKKDKNEYNKSMVMKKSTLT